VSAATASSSDQITVPMIRRAVKGGRGSKAAQRIFAMIAYGDDPAAQRLILLGLEKFLERPQAIAAELTGATIDAESISATVVRAMAAREAAMRAA
jgi:hypothetical protein